ncbi:MAG: protease modulator HflC [Treponemataceae bacterium]|nr:protease modulator HflC [Treponemataceae bacterium]
MKKLLISLTVVIALLVVFLMMGPFYIVDEGSQVVVTRFGKIIDSHNDAGLYFKMPFVDQVTVYPKRILSLDGEAYRIPTKENQFIILDATSRWRISEPEKFYQSLKTLDNAYNRLADIVDSATRTVIAQNRLSEVVRTSNLINENIVTDVSLNDSENQIESLINARTTSEVVTKGRRQLSFEMVEEARKMTNEYGIELIDILPRQIKYSDEMTDSVYNRMIKERNQVAEAYRSKGEGDKAEWLGKLEKDKLTIESEAYRKAEEIKGQADAEAAAIYAEAYDVDKEFYSFWKSLESYKQTLKNFDTTFTTDMDYFDYLYSTEGNR